MQNLDFGDPTPLSEDEFEVVTLCKLCAKKQRKNGEILTEIDKAGDWDICSGCEAQNVPETWQPGILSGMPSNNHFNPTPYHSKESA